MLTCTGDLSRNRHVGIELGRGRRARDILSDMRMVAEGVRTTGAALALGAATGSSCRSPRRCRTCSRAGTPREAVEALMLSEAETED